MNENICLANFGDKLKVSGKVDLQYVLEDGSVIHNEAKNMAFPSTWAASGLIKSLLRDKDILLELTDGDDYPDLKFPFLKGEPVGYAYLNSTSTGNYRGAEIANKRIVTFENGKLVLSFTYEWTASQIKGVIRTIGYTLQNKSYTYDYPQTFNWLTIPIFTPILQKSFRSISGYGQYPKVYDRTRAVTWEILNTASTGSDTGGYYTQIKMTKYYNDGAFADTEKTIKIYLTDKKPYTGSLYDWNMLYNADEGTINLIFDYQIRETNSSNYDLYRCLVEIDFDNSETTTVWKVKLNSFSSSSSVVLNYINPFRSKNLTNYKCLIQKNNKVYIKLESSNVFNVISYINEDSNFTSTFCYTSPENLKQKTDISMFSFCKKFKKIISDDRILDYNYGFGGGDSSNNAKGFVLNISGDIAYINNGEHVIYGSSYTSPTFSVMIDPDTDQTVFTKVLYSRSSTNSALSDGAIEHISNGEEEIYYIPRNADDTSPIGCADAQIFQALTHFHVPTEAQVRPENSGVRIVYELTISNPT